MTSDLRLSQTHYRDKNSSHSFFKAVDDDDDTDRPMQTTTLMNATIPENLNGINTSTSKPMNPNKVLLGASQYPYQRQPSKPHILLRQYKRAEKRSRRSLVSTLETYTNSKQGGVVVQYMPSVNSSSNHGNKRQPIKAGNKLQISLMSSTNKGSSAAGADDSKMMSTI